MNTRSVFSRCQVRGRSSNLGSYITTIHEMKYAYLILLAGAIFSLMTCNGQVVTSAEKTTTYRIITADKELLGDNKAEVELCVQLLDAASERIQKFYGKKRLRDADLATAIQILSTIDSVFTEFGFLFYTNEDIHFDFLTLAFRELFDSKNLEFANRYRYDYFKKLNKPYCREIDCDLYCFVYLGIAEMNDLPLTMVELPHHNFIHWNFPSGQHMNWEAIDGRYHPMDSTLSCFYHLQEFDNNSKKYFLRDWPTSEVLSYYYSLRGSKFDNNPKYKDPVKAKRDYEMALSLYDSNAFVMNNYVWLFVTYSDFDSEFDQTKLCGYSDRAIRLINDLNYYDTKAALYAQAHDFSTAIKIEEAGLQVKCDPDGARKDAEKHLAWFKKNITVREGPGIEQDSLQKRKQFQQ